MEMLITDDQGYEQEDKDVDEEKDDLSMTLKTKMSFRWSMSAQFTLISPGSLILGLVPKEEWKSTKKSSCKEKVPETQNQHRSCYPGNL